MSGAINSEISHFEIWDEQKKIIRSKGMPGLPGDSLTGMPNEPADWKKVPGPETQAGAGKSAMSRCHMHAALFRRWFGLFAGEFGGAAGWGSGGHWFDWAFEGEGFAGAHDAFVVEDVFDEVGGDIGDGAGDFIGSGFHAAGYDRGQRKRLLCKTVGGCLGGTRGRERRLAIEFNAVFNQCKRERVFGTVQGLDIDSDNGSGIRRFRDMRTGDGELRAATAAAGSKSCE